MSAPHEPVPTGPLPTIGDPTEDTPSSVWDPRFVWVTVGAVALVFLAAMQALAVTTVMPVVAVDLDGAALYAVAFAGFGHRYPTIEVFSRSANGAPWEHTEQELRGISDVLHAVHAALLCRCGGLGP